MPPVILGPRCNRRVTCDPSPSNARSESDLVVNPLDPYNMVGSSKRFTNPATYAFSLAPYVTFDGGQSWTEGSLSLLGGWAGTSDPAVAWGNTGDAYLVGLPFGPLPAMNVLGICVYRSADAGRTWGAPLLIHASGGDDKQDAAGDTTPSSPHYGNVYAVWDDGSTLRFARTTDHGGSWKGTGAQAAGSTLASDSFAPWVTVAPDGAVYIVWINGQSGSQIKFVKSTDGGNSFSAPAVAANGITSLRGALPETNGWPHFPGTSFRVLTIATGCAGAGGNVVFAWADYREGASRIYYRRSTNGGGSWQGPAAGQKLLTGAISAALHDFHPQLACTPAGEFGCAFYELGPHGGGEFPSQLIDVGLAVSTNNGSSFPDRVTVTESPWDPAVDAPLSHGDPLVTFIGDYFGLAASRLGFFPFWTDTRTGVQEIFAAHVAVRPADVYIRDSSSDTGAVPSPGFHWEAPDLIVRQAADGDTTWVNQDLKRDGVTDHYIYAKLTNNGPNEAKNVRLVVTVGNYPSLIGLPGTEFRYPQDWYPGDWTTSAIANRHVVLAEGASVNVANGATVTLPPVLWPAAQIPAPAGWHPCLLAEARADNDDSAGGTFGCDVDADPDPCVYGSYFWGNNNIAQRNLSYAKIITAKLAHIEFPFIVGSEWNRARLLEIIVDKGKTLAQVPMTLRLDAVTPQDVEHPKQPCKPGELVLPDGGRVIVRVGDCDAGELVAPPGTIWRPICPPPAPAKSPGDAVHGGEKVGEVWKLLQPRGGVSIRVKRGELRKATLSFEAPTSLGAGESALLRIFQRNDRRQIVGSVQLQLDVVAEEVEEEGEEKAVKPKPSRRRRPAAAKR
jgi:hypothetical protein